MAKISVLMSVYKEHSEWLAKAIDSILCQTYADFDFIIVNDNPTDERVCRILSNYAERDGRIRIVTNERNMGLAASLNHGLEYVTSEYVARMDADDFSHPDRFEKQLDYIISSKCDLVSAYANNMDDTDAIISNGADMRLSPEAVTSSLRFTNIVSHTGWFAKKSLFDAVDGYRMINAAEDYDLLLRAVEKGFRIGMAGGILMEIRRRESSISSANKLRQFLTLCCLADRFGQLDNFGCDDVESYVAARLTEKKAQNYVKATEYILIASQSGGIKMLIFVLRGLLTSRYAWRYMLHVVKLRIIRKQARNER